MTLDGEIEMTLGNEIEMVLGNEAEMTLSDLIYHIPCCANNELGIDLYIYRM